MTTRAPLEQNRLDQYCQRIGLDAAPPVSPAGLQAIQTAHRRSIPFENLDVMLGRQVAIAPDAVFAKLVSARRGGYCFEHNRLFADMLAACGFTCRLLLARVLLGEPGEPTPRIHCLLLVELDGVPWIADAGFGGAYAPPLELRDGAEAHSTDGAAHRLTRIGAEGTLPGAWLLERRGPADATDGRTNHDDWQAQYAFDIAQVSDADCELGNHWSSTHPTARFTNLHVASLCLPDGFASLVDGQLSIYRAGLPTQKREIGDAVGYADVLQTVFGLSFTSEEITRLPLFAQN